MNELEIREQKGEFFITLDLSGQLIQQTFPKLDSILRALLELSEPEFILLKGRYLHSVDRQCINSLKGLSILFSEQARELAVCQLPDRLYVAELFSPPLSYYATEEGALSAFRQSLPKKFESSDLLPFQVPVLKLTAIAEKEQTTVCLPSHGEITIGRHSQCGLSLPHNIQISRHHCKCYQKEGKFYLEDLNSANGTIFHDAFIEEPVEIRDGDRFKIGNTWIEVSVFYENAAETTLPELKIPDTPQEASPGLELPNFSTPEGDVLQTKFDLKLSDLLAAEGEQDTVRMAVDTDRVAHLYSTFVLQGHSREATSPPGEPKTEFPTLPTKEIALPVLIARKSGLIAPGQSIAGRYKIQQTLGESNCAYMLRCEDASSNSVFLQYAKEPMFLHGLIQSHPNLLLPVAEEKEGERWIRIFSDAGEPIPLPPMPEVKVVEIGMALSDVLISLHKIGRSGFDVAPCHIFYHSNGVPQFALIPAVIYSDLLGEKADVFCLGSLLLELATGTRPVANALGAMEDGEVIRNLQRSVVSLSFGQLVMDILHFDEQDLEKIERRLKSILLQSLVPKITGEKTFSLQLAKVGNTVLSHYTGGKIEKFPWEPDFLTRLSSRFTNPVSDEKLKEIGEVLYHQFFSRKFATSLKESEARHLLLVLDEDLTSMPWEVAHDGENFLAYRYCMARDLVGAETEPVRGPLPSPRVFILADIAPWAQEIKEVLVKAFQQFPNIELKTCDTSEKPLNIVQGMFHCDIFHVIGSVVYQTSDPMDSGWVLSPRKNLFKIRLIQNSPRKPRLTFYQGKTKSVLETHNFLTSLYKLGLRHTVGTLWSVKKPELALVFYRNLFEGMSIGEALLKTREEFADQPYLALSLFLYGPPDVSK